MVSVRNRWLLLVATISRPRTVCRFPEDAFICESASIFLRKSAASIPGRIIALEPPISSSHDTNISSRGRPSKKADISSVRNAALVTRTMRVSSLRRDESSVRMCGLQSASPKPSRTILWRRSFFSIGRSFRIRAGEKWAFLKSTMEFLTQLLHARLQ